MGLTGPDGTGSETVRGEDNEQTFPLNGNASSLIRITAYTDGGNFTSGKLYATASLTARVVDPDGNPINGATVTWSVLSARNNSPAVMSGWESKKTGLTWGDAPESGKDDYTYVYERLQKERIDCATNDTSATDSSGVTTILLTDIVGERIVTVQAKVTIGGTDHTATQAISFGKGPLSVFLAPVGAFSPSLTWEEAYNACNGANAYATRSVAPSAWKILGTTYPANYVGGSTPGTDDGKMPTRAEYHAVSAIDTYPWGYTNPNVNAQGAAFAAGWPLVWPLSVYWTGEAYGAVYAYGVYLLDGIDVGPGDSARLAVACRRYAPDRQGEFPVTPDNASLPDEPAGGTESVTARDKDNERTFPLNDTAAPLSELMVEFGGGGAFTTPGDQGYQSVLIMTVKKYVNGVEDTSWSPEGKVTWTVTSAVSALSAGAEGVWKRAADAKNGLMWVASATDSVDGATDWSADAIQGAAPTGVTAYLADIVGSRTITVTVADSSGSSGGQTFAFGPGPLSAFSKTGANGNGGIQWAEYSSSDNTASPAAASFQESGNSFPAAAFCGGSVNRNVTTDPSGSGPSSSGFTPNAADWSAEYLPPGATGYLERYALSSGLAKTEQLLAVAVYNGSYNTSGTAAGRKGAALAAGWSLGGYNRGWSGEVGFDGIFYAVIVFLDYGNVGWSYVANDYAVAVCVP
jgi:hypothetical protein